MPWTRDDMAARAAKELRKEGFGEGNFKALFESIERDQVERGVLAVKERMLKSVSSATCV